MASSEDVKQQHSVRIRSSGKLLKVPGYRLPIDHELEVKNRFRHGAVDMEFDRMTVRELSMLGLMEALTDKRDWFMKIFDEAIVDKWRIEALAMPLITEKTWDWCLEELRDKAKDFETTKMITVLDMGSRCVKTDSLVPTDLRDALKSAVNPLLEYTPRDWHPGSNNQVLNLVHPSLYPAIYGETRILPRDRVQLDDCLAPHDASVILPAEALPGTEVFEDTDANAGDENDDGRGDPAEDSTGAEAAEHEVSEDPAWPPGFLSQSLDNASSHSFTYDPKEREESNENCWSHKFQWLPCDISFTNDTDTSVAITSYINNLHPDKYRPLYHIVESFVSLAIPAWNQVLVNGPAGRTPIRIKANGAETEPPQPPKSVLQSDVEEPLETQVAKVHQYWELPDNPENEDFFEDIAEDWEDYPPMGVEWKWKRIRKTIHPEPGVPPGTSYADWKAGKLTDAASGADENSEYPPKSTTFRYESVNIQDTFRDTGLQVIVKLASIELTPENPSYAGGSWHIEGMLNEHIVATAIYYFDVDNITESRIRFRQEADLDSAEVSYDQDDHAPLCQLFGVDSLRDEPMIQEIGSIATPSNRFLAFPNTLQHKVEPFSLADPTKPGHRRFLVLWLVDPNYRVLSTANVPPQQHEWWVEKAAAKVGGRVSREIQLMIEEQMKDGTITLEEAKAYRLELMAERTTFADAVQEGIRQYDFCEH